MAEVDISAIAVAIGTAALAIITYIYMVETKKIRIAGQEPVFSVEPVQNSLVGLWIINSGQTAGSIYVDCRAGTFAQKFYILSLGNQGRALLDNLPLSEVINDKQELYLVVDCKDSKGEMYRSEIKIDFAKIINEERTVARQETALGKIANSAEEIAKKVAY